MDCPQGVSRHVRFAIEVGQTTTPSSVLLCNELLGLHRADLLLKVLEELIEGHFHGAFENDLWRGGNLAFHLCMSIIAQICGLSLVRQVYGATSLHRTHRAAWLCDQHDT